MEFEDPAVLTAGLTKRYGRRTAVDDATFEVPRGTVCGILGPNGAGKSTTMRMLIGLVRPTAGTASVLGRDAATDRRFLAREVGYMPEKPGFLPYLSGLRNLEVLVRSSGAVVERGAIPGAIDRVGLTSRGGDAVSSYSFGMQQRLALAAALVTDPQLLVLDEPMNGLDPSGTVDVRRIVSDLASEGRTVLLSSHLLAEVETLCTYVAVFHGGRVKACGPALELLASRASYTLRTEPVDRARAIVEAVLGVGSAIADGDGRLTVKMDEQMVPAIVSALAEARVSVFEVSPRRGTLERFYLEMMAPSTESCGHGEVEL